MTTSLDIWKMLAGVAFFLLAMNFMEQALRGLAGRSFKLFLKKHTNNTAKAIGGAAIITGLLQSSSIVNLLVLSMVGAGVVKMENALALMLGSNLGSTLNSWIVVTLGFNYNIESIVLPVAGVAGILMAFVKLDSKPFFSLRFVFSLAFLFLALGYIKTGMEGFVKQTDLSFFNQYPVVIFLLLGIALTSIVQSSSATIALTLSALHTNAISLYVATAIVLGSEIGTTLKLFLASSDGLAIKKRVALGNFLFNISTVIIVFFLLKPINQFIVHALHIEDPLIALVFFQTFINLCCVALFFPFLKIFGRFLLKRYINREDESFYISKVAVADTDLAMEALENETKHFISHVIDYSLESFDLKESIAAIHPVQESFHSKAVADKYDYIKQLHGEMHGFCIKLQKEQLDTATAERLGKLVATIRNSMYAAKNIRDAQNDISQMRNSSNEIKYNFYIQSREKIASFYQQVLSLLYKEPAKDYFTELDTIFKSVTKGYPDTLQLLYKESLADRVSEVEISTLINFNRELYTSFKSILFGLKDYLLTAKDAGFFDAQPGFIR